MVPTEVEPKAVAEKRTSPSIPPSARWLLQFGAAASPQIEVQIIKLKRPETGQAEHAIPYNFSMALEHLH